jgi:alanyl-tRNA synthetase
LKVKPEHVLEALQYKKTESGFEQLSQQNVDFGGGLERLLMATQNQQDVFQTNLLKPIITSIEKATETSYDMNPQSMRIVTDHFLAATFISSNHVMPSNKEQGYILRRLIRRGLDHFSKLGGKDISSVIESIVEEYKKTDPQLVDKYEFIKNTILEEAGKYTRTQSEAKKFIQKKYHSTNTEQVKTGDELMGVTQISAQDAFVLYTTHGLSPTQIKSLGYEFDDQDFANLMEEHASKSRAGAAQKFQGGLADQEELTIKGHTATHLMHQALRDVLGDKVHQSGSNITTERVRFDFNFDRKLTDEEIKKVENIVNEKIKQSNCLQFSSLLYGHKFKMD